MKKTDLLKKFICGLLLITTTISYTVFAYPKKAEAQAAVVDVGNITQSIITAANTTGSAFSTYSLNFKEYVLDFLAMALAKQLIRQITASVVNWINSGFEGSPSFLTNPAGFFLDVADQITGDFLAKYGGPLVDLCSPFSIDIRLALSFKYHPNIPKRYECTLSKIISNSQNAIAGASINGFTAGDFKQGGWPAFVSMTTEPQNNQIGAYLEANSELSIRVANAQLQKKDQLNQGRGFLSWEKCTEYASNDVNSSNFVGPRQEGGDVNQSDFVGPRQSDTTQNTSKSTCLKKEIQTPGSVIEGALIDNVNGPLHELQLADEINEIVNALFAQLVTTVLKQGLGAISGTSASDSTAYMNQIQQEANNDPTQINTVRNEFINNVQTYITNTTQYKNNKDQSFNLIKDVKDTYDSAKACYGNKMFNTLFPLSPGQIAEDQAKIAEIDSIENTMVIPVLTKLFAETTDAAARLKVLTDLVATANAAKTVNDLNIPSQQYSKMVQDRTLISAIDISNSSQELEQTKNTAAPMKLDAQRKLQECQISPGIQ